VFAQIQLMKAVIGGVLDGRCAYQVYFMRRNITETLVLIVCLFFTKIS
jgi:hypothetical protein